MEIPTWRSIARIAVTEAAHGEPEALIGLIDYLTIDCGIEVYRLVEFAERRFHVSRQQAIRTIKQAYFETHLQ
jgi:hypothetical protein